MFVDSLTTNAIAARDGDRDALQRFVRTGQVDVWRLCARLVGRDLADDACQDAMIRAIGALPQYRGESSARTWLLSITRRTCADTIRQRQRQRRLFDRITSRRIETESVPDHFVELGDLVDSLDEDRRLAFVLTQELGLGYAEAAEVCGCPVGTIRSRVARARTDLLEQIDLPGDLAAEA